jgi:NitT/TauT family transport system substrate-binding protein
MLRQAHGHIVMGLKLFAVAFFILGFVGLAQAGETVSSLLNWVAGGDHAPHYYARTAGRFIAERIDLNLLQGRGSSVAAQAVGAGIDQFGLADMTTVLVAIGKGADEVAIMNVYANYPGGFYWLKSSGIKSIKDTGR